jgi:hypothetical protein
MVRRAGIIGHLAPMSWRLSDASERQALFLGRPAGGVWRLAKVLWRQWEVFWFP